MRKKEVSMIILAGGASSRMGRDKSDLTIDGKTFLEMQIEKGEKLGISDILLSGYHGENKYKYPIIPDRFPGKGAGRGHQGEIAHENLGLLDFTRFLIEEARSHAQRRGKRGVAFLTLGDRVIGFFVELVVHKVQHEIPVEIRDAGHIVEHLAQALLEEPIVGILLDLDQVRHVENLVDVCEAHARVFAKLYRLNIHH